MQTSCFAIVELPDAISLSNCALGIEVPARLAGHEFQIQTPTLRKAGPDVPEHDRFGDFIEDLGPPISAGQILKAPDTIEWGKLTQADKEGNVIASIRHLFALFPDQSGETKEFLEAIHRSNSDWLERLDAFLRLISGQRTLSGMRASVSGNSRFQLFQTNPQKHLSQGPIHIKVSTHKSGPSHATGDQFSEAVRICSEGKEYPLHYQLLLKAYDAHQADDPRTTVIEASTALEVAATRRISTVLSKDGVSEMNVELMLKGHQTLRNRLYLLKRLGVSIPVKDVTLKKEILNIRNKVIHVGHRVTDNEARKLLIHANEIIREITPEFALDPEDSFSHIDRIDE
jgi:hypothetical protein